jgi:hypothetical protein
VRSALLRKPATQRHHAATVFVAAWCLDLQPRSTPKSFIDRTYAVARQAGGLEGC